MLCNEGRMKELSWFFPFLPRRIPCPLMWRNVQPHALKEVYQ